MECRKWYRRIYFQGKNREAGEEIGHVDTGQGWGEGESGKAWETGIDIYALPCVK